MKEGRAPPVHGLSLKAFGNRSQAGYDELLGDFFEEQKSLACPRATRVVRLQVADGNDKITLRDDDEDLVELPAYLSKRGLYKTFLHNLGYCYKANAQGDITYTPDPDKQQQQEQVPSWWTFRQFWKSNYSNMRITNPRADVCGECYIFANRSQSFSNSKTMVVRYVAIYEYI